MIGGFIEAGASIITFHPEASEKHIDRSLQMIPMEGGCKAGLVFKPCDTLHKKKNYLKNM